VFVCLTQQQETIARPQEIIYLTLLLFGIALKMRNGG